MLLLVVVALWLTASLLVAGLCVAAARGDAKQAMALRLASRGAAAPVAAGRRAA